MYGCFCWSNEAARFIGEVPHRHGDDVYQPANEEEPEGDKEEQTGEDFSGVEPVCSEEAQEDGQKKSGQVVFDAHRIGHNLSITQLFAHYQVFLIN